MPVQRMCACLLMLVVTAGASGAAFQRGPVSTGPGTLTAARKFLEGRWSLLSFDVFPAGQPPVHVKGEGFFVGEPTCHFRFERIKQISRKSNRGYSVIMAYRIWLDGYGVINRVCYRHISVQNRLMHCHLPSV